jgi:hypothetical protein
MSEPQQTPPIETQLRNAEEMIWELCRHIRNNEKRDPVALSVCAIDLLMKARDYNQRGYDSYVRWW